MHAFMDERKEKEGEIFAFLSAPKKSSLFRTISLPHCYLQFVRLIMNGFYEMYT